MVGIKLRFEKGFNLKVYLLYVRFGLKIIVLCGLWIVYLYFLFEELNYTCEDKICTLSILSEHSQR